MTNPSAKNVLIIDDDPRNIFALKAVLKARGFSCLTATGGREGTELLTGENNIGVVLLDMMMPDMDGYETIGHIRRSKRAEVPIVAVTAQAMVGDRERCLEAGADEYVSKPIDVDFLVSLLHRYLK